MLRAFLPMFHGNKKAELYLDTNDKGSLVLGIVVDGLPVLHDLLFAREYTSEHLHRVVLAF